MPKEVLKFEKDPTGRLSRFFEKIRTRYFPYLAPARIHYVFRSTVKVDDEGFTVIGEARKLSNHDRDLYGYDFEICMYKETWRHASDRLKERYAWHELNHLIVKWDEDGPKRDKADRIVINIKTHDIVLKTFMEEIELFGPTKEESAAIKKIQSYRRKIKRR